MNHLQYSIWRQQKVYKSSLQFMEVYSSFYFLWLLETWPVRERETTDWEEECRQWDPATGPLCSIITAPRIINTPGLDQFCQTGLNQLGETRLDVISEENGLQVPYLWESWWSSGRSRALMHQNLFKPASFRNLKWGYFARNTYFNGRFFYLGQTGLKKLDETRLNWQVS